MNQIQEFQGVYYFTNPTSKERKYLWNNKEYIFPAESTVPLIIPSETLENIQEIRKRFAYRMAEERLFEGEKVKDGQGNVVFDYSKAKNMGQGLPPTYDSKILEPMIHECLKPLPIKKMDVREGNKLDDESKYKATRSGFTGSPSEVFKESDNRDVLGEMPDHI